MVTAVNTRKHSVPLLSQARQLATTAAPCTAPIVQCQHSLAPSSLAASLAASLAILLLMLPLS